MDKTDNKVSIKSTQNIKEIKLRQVNLIEEKECILLEFSEILNAFMRLINEYKTLLSSEHGHIVTISSDEDI